MQAWKRSYSARLPRFLSLTTSKTQQFCETSSLFELDNVKNETILRDFLIFRSWQHQKRKRNNSARLPSRMESWVQSWRPRTNAFCDFSTPPVKSIAPATYEVLHLSCKIIFPKLKIWCSKMQPLSRNQRPDLLTALMSMSLVLRLPRKMHVCKSSSNVPRCPSPAIIFGNATKPSRFAHFWQRPQSLAPATQNDIWTSKSGPYMLCFVHFDFEMCFAPQQRALFRHLNFQKRSDRGVFCTFWLRNVLRATTACTFSTSQLPKVFQRCGVFSFFTCKILQMCFAPQQRALFRHLNF